MMGLICDSFEQFKAFDFFILIPSKGRPKSCNGSFDLFPKQSCLYVHQDEANDYSNSNKGAVIVKHQAINGYGSVINSAIRLALESKIKYMFIIDDDMNRVDSLVGNRPRRLGLCKRYEVLVNAVQVMADIGCYLYLFSTVSSIIKYQQHLPYKAGFSLPQGCYILDVEGCGVRYNEMYHYYEDFDFCMGYLLKYRYFLIENRILMTGTNIDALTDGGCNSFRTSRNEKASRQWIKAKWKAHVRFTKNQGGNIRPTSAVARVAVQ